MPKASSSTPALRRNQACKQCRRRKLKCDASRPACGTCTRQWTAQVAVPPPVGFSHPTEPICNYDPVEGVHLAPETIEDPAARILLITKEIADLECKLRDAQDEQARSLLLPSTTASSRRSYSLSNPNSRPSSSRGKGKEPAPMTLPDFSNIQTPSLIFQHNAFLESPRSRSSSLSDSPVPSNGHSADLGHLKSISDPGPLLGMLFSDWNPCLPEPAQLRRLVDDFFNNDPCGSRILHRPHFHSLLNLPSSHPDFPHPALLHAICASASRWSQHSASSDSSHSPPPFETSSVKREPTETFHRTRNRFAEYHASKARGYIDQAVSSTSPLLPVLQASAILSWYFYREGRSVEVWLHAGFQTRIAVPLGLNHSFKSTIESASPDLRQRLSPYPDPPRSSRELEERRRVWWETVIFDRLVSVGGWLHSVDEKDIATEFPVCTTDFESQLDLVPNPQSMFSEAALTHHIPAYTDSFVLLVKACMLLGRVTDYNMRMNLRTGGEQPPILLSNPLSPYMAIPPPNTRPASQLSTNDEGAMPPGFRILDNLVAAEFLKSLPIGYKNCLGLGDVANGSDVDADLYLVHLIPHAATITLHSPFTNFGAAKPCRSVARCLEASRSILAAYYLISSTTFDVTRLHPFVNVCWYLAAIVQVRLCQRLIEIGDVANEVQVWGQINTLRQAMLRYGANSPIGLQQEKLLQSAMTDITNMTSQNLPLTIGLTLYSFDSPYDSPSAFHTTSSHPDLLTDPSMRSLPDINTDYTSDDVVHVSKWLDFGDNTALLTPPAKLW